MGWLDGSRAAKQRELDGGRHINVEAIPGARSPHMNGIVEPDGSFEVFAHHGYSRNELVYACITEKATSLPQAQMQVFPSGVGDDQPLKNHRLRRVFEEPNPVTSEFELFELSVTYLDLAGMAYFLIIRGRDGLPSELWPLRPDLVGVIPSPVNPGVFIWFYRPDPERPHLMVPIERRDMIQVKYPNLQLGHPREQRYFGQPPLRAAARAVSLDNAATDFVDRLLRNDATPTTVVTTTERVTEKLADRLRERWVSRFGAKGSGGPAFLQRGMDVKPLGLNLKDLEFPDLRTISESRVCMTLGVHPVLIGAKVGLDASTFTNYREARRSFWDETLMSLQRRFRDPLRSKLVPEFTGPGRRPIELKWDNSEVLALREAESERWTRATNALARGGITRNDFRRTVGLPPVPNGDVFLTPAGVVPEAAGTDDRSAAVANIDHELEELTRQWNVELTEEEARAYRALEANRRER